MITSYRPRQDASSNPVENVRIALLHREENNGGHFKYTTAALRCMGSFVATRLLTPDALYAGTSTRGNMMVIVPQD